MIREGVIASDVPTTVVASASVAVTVNATEAVAVRPGMSHESTDPATSHTVEPPTVLTTKPVGAAGASSSAHDTRADRSPAITATVSEGSTPVCAASPRPKPFSARTSNV